MKIVFCVKFLRECCTALNVAGSTNINVNSFNEYSKFQINNSDKCIIETIKWI